MRSLRKDALVLQIVGHLLVGLLQAVSNAELLTPDGADIWIGDRIVEVRPLDDRWQTVQRVEAVEDGWILGVLGNDLRVRQQRAAPRRATTVGHVVARDVFAGEPRNVRKRRLLLLREARDARRPD